MCRYAHYSLRATTMRATVENQKHVTYIDVLYASRECVMLEIGFDEEGWAIDYVSLRNGGETVEMPVYNVAEREKWEAECRQLQLQLAKSDDHTSFVSMSFWRMPDGPEPERVVLAGCPSCSAWVSSSGPRVLRVNVPSSGTFHEVAFNTMGRTCHVAILTSDAKLRPRRTIYGPPVEAEVA